MNLSYTFKEFKDILGNNKKEKVVYRKILQDAGHPLSFTYFFLGNVSPLKADNKIQLQTASVIVHVYRETSVINTEQSKKEYRDYINYLMEKFQVMPLFSDEVPQLENYQCAIFEIPVIIDISEWL